MRGEEEDMGVENRERMRRRKLVNEEKREKQGC